LLDQTGKYLLVIRLEYVSARKRIESGFWYFVLGLSIFLETKLRIVEVNSPGKELEKKICRVGDEQDSQRNA
jgi:hypothetical protein